MKDIITLQITSWEETKDKEIIYNEVTDEDDEHEKYIIKVYGRTMDDNKSIVVKLVNYKPFFYFKKPDYWNDYDIRKYINNIKKNVNSKTLYGFENYEIIKSCDMVGFNGGKVFDFIKLIFTNMQTYYAFRGYIKKTVKYDENILKKNYNITLYESKIKPFLDFIHIKGLDTCGWLKVIKYKKNKYVKTCMDISIICNYDDVEYIKDIKMSKQVIASFDIECYSSTGLFPKATVDDDCITQIGTVFCYYGETEPFLSNIITLNGCARIKGLENAEIEAYESESKVLIAWTKLMRRVNPDYVVGYNINMFDFKYMHDRALKLNILNEFSMLNRHSNILTTYMDGSDKKNKMGSSKAFGDNELYYYDFDGRILIDLLTYVKRNIPLGCYKLDYVATTYIKEKIIKYENIGKTCKIYTNSIYGLKEDHYVNISYFDGLTDNTHEEKYKILNFEDINEKEKIIVITGNIPLDLINFKKLSWCLAKDDITPNDLFRLFKGSDEDRGIIAKYCLMDCILVIKIMEKLQVLNNNIGMANVCSVPLSYIFMRGQSIKAHSLISKICKKENHLIPDRDPPENMDDSEKQKYEGAIVFEPKEKKVYEDTIVLDFASLYPSTAICYNISHETVVLDKQYENLKDYQYHTIKFDVNGIEQVWKYAEKKDGTKGIIPRILDDLLKKRKQVKEEMKHCKDPFMEKILDGLQNAYKITANSIYGLLGAVVSPVYLEPLAPSITSGGRGMLKYARKFINTFYNKLLNLVLKNDYDEYEIYAKEYFKQYPERRFNDKNYKNKKEYIKYFYDKVKEIIEHIDNKETLILNPKVIYGDTDSVFFIMNYNIKFEKKLMTSIKFGQLAGETICKTLPEPEKMVYEKTLSPFIILAKKKYVGNLYEDNDIDFYQKNMGIVLKRRDNAKIVKIVVGGIVDYMLNKNDKAGAVQYVRTILKDILRGKYPIEYFIISKTLKKTYKKRHTIAHACLADRIAIRDPGNKPNVNDRIQFVYFINGKKTKLQGDKIEDPTYILENDLKIDYLHYITNQIEKPSLQFLELICNNPKTIFNNCVNSEIKRRKGQKSIEHHIYNNIGIDIGIDENINNNSDNNTNDSSTSSVSFSNEEIKTDTKNNSFTITF